MTTATVSAPPQKYAFPDGPSLRSEAERKTVPYTTDPSSGFPDGCIRSEVERNAKATDNYRLIHGYLRRYQRRYAEDEDVIQEAWLGLLRAAETWDEAGGQSFSSHAYRGMRNYVQAELATRNVIRVPRDAKFEADAARARAVVSIHGGNGIDVPQPFADDCDDNEETIRLRAVHEELSPAGRLFLKRRYEEDLTLMEIACEMDVSPARAGQIQAEVIDRLRVAMERHDMFDGPFYI